MSYYAEIDDYIWLEVDERGELDYGYLMNDRNVSDSDYAIIEEHLREHGVRWND